MADELPFPSFDDVPVVTPEKGIYIIFDKVAKAFVGNVVTERHDGPVCRLFVSLLKDPASFIGANPRDFMLCRSGTISEEGVVTGFPNGPRTVMTGEAWLATLESADGSAQ